MALNGGAINSRAINAPAGFTQATGGGVVVSFVQKVHALGNSTSNIVQRVGKKSTPGAKITFEQIVDFRQTGTATISLEQIVASRKAAFNVELEQIVVPVSAPNTFFGRNGFEPLIYIAGEQVPANQLHKTVSATFRENEAAQFIFTIIPPTGVQDLRSYRGKEVIYKIRTAEGTYPIFKGKINTPEVEIVDQKITMYCSADIEQLVNDTYTRQDLDKVGYYNNIVFSKPITKYQELQDRISTVPQALIIDPAGIPSVVDIAAKASADYTLTNSNVFRREIGYTFSSRQRYINKVNIKVNYSYQRLHHQEVSCNWAIGFEGGVCAMLVEGYTLAPRELIASAVQGSDWPLKGGISFSPVWPGGWYNCWYLGRIYTVGWSTIQCEYTTEKTGEKTDDGTERVEISRSSCTNTGVLLCNGAGWVATKRYAQNMTHSYTLTVQAPESQTKYGDKEKDDNFDYNDPYDATDWEDYSAYTASIPDGLVRTGTQNTNFWIDAKTGNKDFNTSLIIVLNRAKSDILKSHREDMVTFLRTLWPNISLKDTVYLDTDRVEAKGKIYSYTHDIDILTSEATTQVELALSRSEGGVSDDNLALPTQPTSTPSYPITTLQLDSHYGVDPELNDGTWTGYIGNKVVQGKGLTSYPVSFINKTPEVPASLRDDIILEATASYDVALPNDDLTITFTDN